MWVLILQDIYDSKELLFFIYKKILTSSRKFEVLLELNPFKFTVEILRIRFFFTVRGNYLLISYKTGHCNIANNAILI